MFNFLILSCGRQHAVLAICAATFTALAAGVAFAAPPDTDPASQAAAKPLNGYGEQLRPAVRKKTSVPDQPYMPIKKQDDHLLIPEIDMFVGESRVFPAPNVGRIAVGNGQIMTAAALDRKEVIVFANAAGTSSLFVWNEDGRYQRIKVNIVAGDTSRVAREVATFLSAIPHAKTSIVGDKVIVDGDGLADADLLKIEQLEKRYPQIVNFTNKIGWEQMVLMDVKVVEFPRSELKEIGLKWGAVGGTTFGAIWSPAHAGRLPANAQYQVNIPAGQAGLPITAPGGAGNAVLPTSLNLISGLNLGLSAQLNLLEQEGRASVLAEPQLSARNGAKASFLAGGEFPYSVSNNNGVTIIFKPYGIKLDITPRVDRNGIVRATVMSEVSSIDASVSAVGGPALLTRRTETEFNVQAGETIVLSGLLQRNASTDVDKVPLLGDLPVLGALFRSKRFQNKETELVVFVTPTVVDSRSPGLVDRVRQATQRLEEQTGRPPYLNGPLEARPQAQPEVLPQSSPSMLRQPQLRPQPQPQSHLQPQLQTPLLPPLLPPLPLPLPQISTPADSSQTENDAPIEPVGQAASRRRKTSDLEQISSLVRPPNGSGLQVTSRTATVRADPSRSASALLTLKKGTTMQLADKPAAPASPWWPVTVGSVEGWILGSAVAQVEKQTPQAPHETGFPGAMDATAAVLRHDRPLAKQ